MEKQRLQRLQSGGLTADQATQLVGFSSWSAEEAMLALPLTGLLSSLGLKLAWVAVTSTLALINCSNLQTCLSRRDAWPAKAEQLAQTIRAGVGEANCGWPEAKLGKQQRLPANTKTVKKMKGSTDRITEQKREEGRGQVEAVREDQFKRHT